MPFPRLLALCEMQTAQAKIRTRVNEFISYDDNYYPQAHPKKVKHSLDLAQGQDYWAPRENRTHYSVAMYLRD